MNPSQTEKRPITADAALMNPVAKILALRSGEYLQVKLLYVLPRDCLLFAASSCCACLRTAGADT